MNERQKYIVARICHLCWVSYQLGAGQDYNEEPDKDDLASNMDGIEALLSNPNMTVEQNHENWMAYKLADGWVYGPVKDDHAKTHPDLVPFEELPDVEQRKDIMDLIARRTAIALVEELA